MNMTAVRRWIDREDGIGIITALAISAIVFGLAATWYALSVHEISEVTQDRARIGAINVAEAGAREMMYLLATDETIRDQLAITPFEYSTGVTSGTCDAQLLQVATGAGSVTVGEYWVRVTKSDPSDPNDLRYLIESWAWAPNRTARQHDEKKVMFEVELKPYGGGFTYALFAGQYGITGSNQKTIYGDLYSGQDLIISNKTSVLPNDAGWDGDGDLNVFGNLLISGGSNNEFSGVVSVNGYVDDQKVNTLYKQDVIALDQDASGNPLAQNNYFRKPTVIGSLVTPQQADGNLSNVNDQVYPAVGIPPVPQIALPQFTWNPGQYDVAVDHGSDTAAFGTWFNQAVLGTPGQTEAHRVEGNVTLDFGSTRFAGEVVIVVDGDVTMSNNPIADDPTGDPVTVVVVVQGSTHTLGLAQHVAMSDSDNVHFLGYSEGSMSASNLTTVYGSLYAEGDTSGNKLEIHYRPLESRAVTGFAFDPALANLFMPQPGVWREVPVDEPVALSAYCTP